MTVVYALLAALLGIVVGIIINALSDDLPYRENPRLPHYPGGEPRPISAWSGILAFVTGQRSPANLAPDEVNRLSWRQPAVEIFMALLFGGVVLNWPDEPRLVVWFVFLSILTLITVIDLEHRLILFVVIIPSVVVVLILNFLFPDQLPEGGDRPFKEFIFGLLLGGGVFLIMFWGGGVFANTVAAMRGEVIDEPAFGFGDVMLAILCGAMIGWRAMIFAMFITVFAGAIGAVLYLLARFVMRERYSMFTPLPYGQYIVFGTMIMLLFVDEVRNAF